MISKSVEFCDIPSFSGEGLGPGRSLAPDNSLGCPIFRSKFCVTIRQWPETPNWKLATAVACLVLIGAAAIAWQVHSAKTTAQRLAEDAKACRERADRGDAKAESRLASMYSRGLGVPQDFGEALRWRRKAADQNYAGGEDGLGSMYYYGEGVPQDYGEALRWYHKAADQGDPQGEESVAYIYLQGEGVPQEYAEALRWYRKAADQGYARAQYDLGTMYYHGRGVPQDSAEAVRWYQKAADQGDELAQRVLHWKLKGMSTPIKVSLSIMFLGNSLVLLGSLRPRGSRHGGRRRVFTLAGLFGLSYVALDLLGFRYLGMLTPVSAIGAFYFVKSVLGGTCVAILLQVALPDKHWPKVVKIGLATFGILLVGSDLFVIANHRLRSAGPALRSFWSINGSLLGLLASLAICLWMTHKEINMEQDLDSEIPASDS